MTIECSLAGSPSPRGGGCWASRFPECAAIPNTWAAITAAGSTWRDPGGSALDGNLGWQLSRWDSEGGHAYSFFASVADNVQDADPRFVDEPSGNLALAADSPTLAIPAFPTSRTIASASRADQRCPQVRRAFGRWSR